MRDSLLLAAIALSLAASAKADPPVPTMRADTRVLEIDVIVRDSHGKPVEDLKQSDFTVTDDGKTRMIDIFSVNRYPSDLPSAAPIGQTKKTEELPALPPNVFTNTGAGAKPTDGHSTIILLDCINGWFETVVFARQGLLGLMAKVPSNEKIAIYVIQNAEGLGMLQDYTTDRTRLTDAVARFTAKGLHPSPPGGSYDGQGMVETRRTNEPPPPPDAAKRRPGNSRRNCKKVRKRFVSRFRRWQNGCANSPDERVSSG